jgi:glucosamine--fructose-6-phosphate aminotransferase (isomerizing)
MTYFLQDILRQPDELQRTIDYLSGTGRPMLDRAAATLRDSRHVYLTGIGSSWNAALSVEPMFFLGGRPVYVREASELLHFSALPGRAVLLVISRSGRSVEIVKLLAKARQSGAIVVGITSSGDGDLAREAQISLVVPTRPDHGISVNTYSTLAAAAGALASECVGIFDRHLVGSLSQAVADADRAISSWQEQIANTAWLSPGRVPYFLARGPSLGSCHGARLLWEEGGKSPATAMGTGSFRHGPQEIIARDMRFGMWIHGSRMRSEDLAVARDLGQLGASVMLIGQDLPKDAGDLIFQLPEVPCEWQFLVDLIPAQLAAERLARVSGVDCDSFRLCSYVVEDEYGLLPGEVVRPRDQ